MIGSSQLRRAGTAGLGALAAVLVALGGFAPTPAHAAPGGSPRGHAGGHWHFDGTATTVTDLARVIGADRLWRAGVTGAGVGVALVDTGVVPVPGLRADHVANGPDLSLDNGNSDARYLDTYGHGTHLAGIIGGSGDGFRGVAPGATITSVKVGAFDGAVDVSQVIAGLDWVVAHRADDPNRPIRVVNISFGTDGVQDSRVDPLTHAVENAWRAGIVVVVAAGNGGTGGWLANPGYDPYVLAVGAADTHGTVGTGDDTVTDFSSRGDAARRPDLVAPGMSIVSLRDPGSYVDENNPTARVGDRYFKGSGTSQAAAVVSGAVSLLLSARPELTPDQVKAALTRGAARLPGSDAGQGAGELDLARALLTPVGFAQTRGATQTWAPSTGTGSLEAARGSAHLVLGGDVLSGEFDLWGSFDASAWARASSAGTAWVGGTWMGHQLAGSAWTGTSWAGRTWAMVTWPGQTWSGVSWSGLHWSGVSWSGHYWSGLHWSGLHWSGLYWSGLHWSDQSWAG